MFYFFICLFILVGCYKEDRYSFVEGDYILAKEEDAVCEFDGYEINDIRFTEIPGSSNYNDRYYFM